MTELSRWFSELKNSTVKLPHKGNEETKNNHLVFSKTKQCKYPMPVDFPRCGRLVLLRGIASLTIMARRLLLLANTAKCGDHNYAFR